MSQDNHSRPIDVVTSRLEGFNKQSSTALCPAHGDKQQSLSVKEGNDGRVLLKCFAGCATRQIVQAMGLEMKDLFPEDPNRKPKEKSQPLTVESLGKSKCIPLEHLQKWKVAEAKKGVVRIPYFFEDGSQAPRNRMRAVIDAQKKNYWEGKKEDGPIVPYGLWLLNNARQSRSLIICEGESDCWTFWMHDMPALGIPSATMTKTLQTEHLSGIESIHIVREPDAGGDNFVPGMQSRLKELGYSGKAYEVPMSKTAKDPNAVYVQCKQNGTDFRAAWQRLIDTATPIRERQETHNLQARIQSFNTTDVGNSQRLIARHGKDLRYCFPWKKWVVWDGKRWVKDDTAEVLRKAKETVKSIYAEAANSPDDSERKSLAKHALKSEAETRIKSMVSLAQSEPNVPVLPESLDVHDMLLNVLNGTLDLRTGNLREHKREDFQTKVVPVEFDPSAECPTWGAFLNRIMDGKQELIRFLQKAVGYALTGDVGEQVMFFLYGNTGKNGKSTFLNTFKELLGDYALAMQPDTLMAKQSNRGASNDIARLKGARFVPTIEGEEGQRLAESLIKQMTGGDVMTARFLHQEFFDFKPTHKIFFATNHLPNIRGTDDAIWRRIRQIPFNITIPEHERDNKLPEKLRAEFPGILKWAVDGCLMWQQEGLGMPEEIRSATDEYRQDMDVLAAFLADYCVVASQAKAKASELYTAYKQWCEENGEYCMSQKALGTKLKDKGFRNRRGTGGAKLWEGIGLRMDDYEHSDKVVPMKRDIPSGVQVEATSDDMEVFKV